MRGRVAVARESERLPYNPEVSRGEKEKERGRGRELVIINNAYKRSGRGESRVIKLAGI